MLIYISEYIILINYSQGIFAMILSYFLLKEKLTKIKLITLVIALIGFLWLKWIIKNPFKILSYISIAGIIFNWYVIWNEYFLGSYCLLCLICTAIILAVLWLSIIWLKWKNEK